MTGRRFDDEAGGIRRIMGARPLPYAMTQKVLKKNMTVTADIHYFNGDRALSTLRGTAVTVTPGRCTDLHTLQVSASSQVRCGFSWRLTSKITASILWKRNNTV